MNIDKTTLKIVSFDEKINQNEGFINAGIYLMNRNIFADYKGIDTFSIEEDFFSKIIFTKKVFAFELKGAFIDIGTNESYHRAQKLLNLG